MDGDRRKISHLRAYWFEIKKEDANGSLMKDNDEEN